MLDWDGGEEGEEGCGSKLWDEGLLFCLLGIPHLHITNY